MSVSPNMLSLLADVAGVLKEATAEASALQQQGNERKRVEEHAGDFEDTTAEAFELQQQGNNNNNKRKRVDDYLADFKETVAKYRGLRHSLAGSATGALNVLAMEHGFTGAELRNAPRKDGEKKGKKDRKHAFGVVKVHTTRFYYNKPGTDAFSWSCNCHPHVKGGCCDTSMGESFKERFADIFKRTMWCAE